MKLFHLAPALAGQVMATSDRELGWVHSVYQRSIRLQYGQDEWLDKLVWTGILFFL